MEEGHILSKLCNLHQFALNCWARLDLLLTLGMDYTLCGTSSLIGHSNLVDAIRPRHYELIYGYSWEATRAGKYEFGLENTSTSSLFSP